MKMSVFKDRIDSPSAHIRKYKCTAKNKSNPIENNGSVRGFAGNKWERYMWQKKQTKTKQNQKKVKIL